LPSNRPQANKGTLIARRDRPDLVAERRGRIQERQVAYDKAVGQEQHGRRRNTLDASRT
jgi:hypothetical protein